MKLYRTAESGVVVDVDGVFRAVDLTVDEVFTAADPIETVAAAFERSTATVDEPRSLLAPIGSQEVWAAGVTYEVSREARMAESEAAGTSDVYAKVYDAVRPEIFFKATAHRVAGPDAAIRIRSDAVLECARAGADLGDLGERRDLWRVCRQRRVEPGHRR